MIILDFDGIFLTQKNLTSVSFQTSFIKSENYSLKITFYQMHHQTFYACKIVFLHLRVSTKTFAGINFRQIIQTLRNSLKLLLLR